MVRNRILSLIAIFCVVFVSSLYSKRVLAEAVSVEVLSPLTILVNRSIYLNDSIIELSAPWTALNFNSETMLNVPVVITSMSAKVFDPVLFEVKDVEIKKIPAAIPLNNMGTVFPKGFDCDNTSNPNYKCENAIDFKQFFIDNMSSHSEDQSVENSIAMIYRKAKFIVMLTMKGQYLDGSGVVETTTVTTTFEAGAN